MIEYRDGGASDAALMSRIGKQTFVETFGHLYTPENLAAFLENHSEENWLGELTNPAFAIRIAEDLGEPAGFAKVGPPSLPFEPTGPTGPTAELRQLYVLKPWHGQGVAHALMDWAIDEARRRCAGQMYLSVFVDNHRARRFYDRYGFEAVGTYDFMVGTHADLDIIMRKVL